MINYNALKYSFTSGNDGIDLVKSIQAMQEDGYSFQDSTQEKQLFELDEMTNTLYPMATYNYAFTSALINQVNKELKNRSVEQEEKPREKLDDRVRDAIETWKNENAGNDKYITTTYAMQPATRFYAGKQGETMAIESGIFALTDEELMTIKIAAEGMKNSCAFSIKTAATEGWVKEKMSYTPEGWKEYYKIKYSKMLELKLMTQEDYEEKMNWVENNKFEQGWNYNDKNNGEIDEYKINSLSEEAKEVISQFQISFCNNAIEKDNLLVGKE